MDCVFGLLIDNKFDSAREYVEKINEGFIEDIHSLDTGHPIVNIVLNQKIRYASDRGISLVPVFNNLKQIKIDKDDIVVILSNLLDNAIEACERLKISKKEIKISIEDDDTYTTLTIKNPIENVLFQSNGKLHSSKVDKLNHGIGLSNVENIVRKYNGECMYSNNDSVFTYTIHIDY
jgi:sensor histidine kinase regulating citrate/malate metabolism